jgi:hypothetical protein
MLSSILSYFSPRVANTLEESTTMTTSQCLPELDEMGCDEDLVDLLASIAMQPVPSHVMKTDVGVFNVSEKVFDTVTPFIGDDDIYHVVKHESKEGIEDAIAWMHSKESNVSVMSVATAITLMRWKVKVRCIKLEIKSDEEMDTILSHTFNHCLHSETIEYLMQYCYDNKVTMKHHVPLPQYLRIVTDKERKLSSNMQEIDKFLHFAIKLYPRCLKRCTSLNKTIAFWLIIAMKHHQPGVDELLQSFQALL